MSGHGTILIGADGQDNATIYVNDNGGSEHYAKGEHECLNDSGTTVEVGDVVFCDWENDRLCATGKGVPATGTVSSSGTRFRVTDAGDTGLSGDIAIAENYGENQGFGGESDVSASNVNGEAAYLR